MPTINLTTYSDDDLDQLRRDILIEQERRYTLANTETQMNLLNERYVEAIGRQDGGEWRQPSGAHDAYCIGSVAQHNGKTWVSTTPANVWEPGVSGWREQAEADPETGDVTVPEYLQPTGAHDAYKVGDRVTFEGSVYESLIDGNVWSPAAHPPGWKKID